jgi:hypothetical protein
VKEEEENVWDKQLKIHTVHLIRVVKSLGWASNLGGENNTVHAYRVLT